MHRAVETFNLPLFTAIKLFAGDFSALQYYLYDKFYFITINLNFLESTSIPNLKINGGESNGDVDTNLQNKEERICSICKLINTDDFEIDPEELNYLTGFIFSRIKSWVNDIN